MWNHLPSFNYLFQFISLIKFNNFNNNFILVTYLPPSREMSFNYQNLFPKPTKLWLKYQKLNQQTSKSMSRQKICLHLWIMHGGWSYGPSLRWQCLIISVLVGCSLLKAEAKEWEKENCEHSQIIDQSINDN